MPYIHESDRKSYIVHLQKLTDELAKLEEEDLGGHLNYCISFLIKSLFSIKCRYVRANTIRGAVENALSEFYRCQVAPYEDIKRAENGEV